LRSSPALVQLSCGVAAGVLVYGPLALVPRIRQDLADVLSVTRSAVQGRR
jgi:hypothetical protein